jgi:6-pyruvoyltetrahydropterin/6-carboxytetrahydropterin synthase
MLIDYGDVTKAIDALREERLDHHFLNESLGLEHPTSELIAKHIFDYLKPALGDLLLGVMIEETCTSKCLYTDKAFARIGGSLRERLEREMERADRALDRWRGDRR